MGTKNASPDQEETLMGEYHQLTEEDRIEIYALLKAGQSNSGIGQALGRSTSTIGREIERNSGKRGYRPKQAHRLAQERRKKSRNTKMTAPVIAHVEAKIAEDWSPEQISGTMQEAVGVRVSHERIYQHLWQDKRAGGLLYKRLRIAGRRKYRKRYGKWDLRGQIANRVSIEERPGIVESKERFGDWEADCVVGAHHKGFLVTLVERRGKGVLIGHCQHKRSEEVSQEIIRLMSPYRQWVRTITFDNGREFAGHQQVAKALSCDCYFAHPYQSWERGLNENTNGLIRQYFPKGTDLRGVTAHEIEQVTHRLNHRPRKTLDYQTPQKVFWDTINTS
jgi:IS30 family transposase